MDQLKGCFAGRWWVVPQDGSTRLRDLASLSRWLNELLRMQVQCKGSLALTYALCIVMTASAEGDQPRLRGYAWTSAVCLAQDICNMKVSKAGRLGLLGNAPSKGRGLVWILCSHHLVGECVGWLLLKFLVGSGNRTWLSSLLLIWSLELISSGTFLLEEELLWPLCLVYIWREF